MYTPYEEANEEQKKDLKKLFKELLFDLLIVEVCIAAIYIFDLAIVGLVGIFFAISAFNAVRIYGSAVLGSGLHTVFLFFENRIRIVDDFSGREIPYRFITGARYFEKGLVMRFKDGGTAGITIEALEQSESGPDVIKLMDAILKTKFKNLYDGEKSRSQRDEEERIQSQKRNDALGYKIAEAFYEPDGKDFRDYCRLIMNTGKTKKTLDILLPILFAFCVALPVFSFITGEYMLDAVMYILLILAGLLLFVSKIGIGSPARSVFPVRKHETLKIRIHYDGISVKTQKKKEELYLWREVENCLFHPEIGISFTLKETGTVFIPVDIVEREVAQSIFNRAEPIINAKGEKVNE